MRERRTPAEAKAIIERHQMSGLSIQAFCAKECIKPVTFYYWRKHLGMIESQEPSTLIPVCLDKSGTDNVKNDGKSVELAYPNGVRLLIPEGSDLNFLRELVMLF